MAISEELLEIAKYQKKTSLYGETSAEETVLQAMKSIVNRIKNGEIGLFDPANSGDTLAIALAEIE